jgi:hypothetical protein
MPISKLTVVRATLAAILVGMVGAHRDRRGELLAGRADAQQFRDARPVARDPLLHYLSATGHEGIARVRREAFDLLALDHHLPSGTVRARDPHDTERDPGAYFRDRGRASPSLYVTGRALGRDIGVSREPAARSRGDPGGSRARVERAAERRADPGVDRQGGVDRRDGDRARHQRFQVRLSGGRGRRNPRPLSQQRRPQGRPRGGRRRHRLDRGGNAAGDRPRVAHRQCARPRAQRLAQLRARPGLPRDVRD